MKQKTLKYFVAVLISMVSLCATAQSFEIGSVTYKILSKTDKTVSVKKIYKKYRGSLIIPETVEYNNETYRVTEIANRASYDGSLENITLPNGITSIGSAAFMFCTNLKSVTIPNGVTSIEDNAFYYCTNLLSAIVPNSVTKIGYNVFFDCRRLTSVTFPKNMPSLGKRIFDRCVKINDVKCEDGSFPYYIFPYLPENCPFLLAKKYQQSEGNSNMYAQNVQQQPVQQQPIQTPKAEEKNPSSDVDINLPTTPENNDKTFAIIFANENYQEVAHVDYAQNDGEIFKEYCKSILGIPEKNIQFRKNATKNNMIADMMWIKDVADAYNGEAKFIVFYAGHGIPNEKSNEAYLLPVDGLVTNPATAYSLGDFYKELSSLNAAHVTVFIDACFSGSQRGEGMLASARGVVITPRKETPAGNMVVFSAAQGDETAYPYKEKGHGLFTYYLLKKLRDTKGDCTLQELGDYIQTNVKRQSIVVNRKSQTPSVSASQQLATSWTTMKLR